MPKADDETTIVRRGRTEHVVDQVDPAPPYIDPGPSYGTEHERVRLGPDREVEHDRERIERRPLRGLLDDFWSALAILSLAALIGFGALNVSKGTGLVDVPSLVGLTRADAEAQLSDAGLEANVFEVPSIEPAGTVVAQNPLGGQLRQGEAVRINCRPERLQRLTTLFPARGCARAAKGSGL
jgi:PASTA domain